MKRILKPVTYVIAALYFLVDAAFMAIAKPISDWLARHVVLRRLRAWIRSLRPYPSLALFSVPVIMLEPVKPVAAYLAATGRMVSSVVTLIVGELLKLVLVERLLRGAASHARWAVKPLCLGLAAMFAFDLFFHADAMLFGRYDIDAWAARGSARSARRS